MQKSEPTYYLNWAQQCNICYINQDIFLLNFCSCSVIICQNCYLTVKETSKGRNWGVDEYEISPIFYTKYFIDFYLTRFKQGFIYTFYKDTKKNKQHVLDTIYCFKTILQHVQYALTNILQKSSILWTKRQQPFLMHSITFSLI